MWSSPSNSLGNIQFTIFEIVLTHSDKKRNCQLHSESFVKEAPVRQRQWVICFLSLVSRMISRTQQIFNTDITYNACFFPASNRRPRVRLLWGWASAQISIGISTLSSKYSSPHSDPHPCWSKHGLQEDLQKVHGHTQVRHTPPYITCGRLSITHTHQGSMYLHTLSM